MRALLVEDHQLMVRPLKEGLDRHGVAVDVALDRWIAGEMALTEEYDAIILDLMPLDDDQCQLIRSWRDRGLQSHIVMLVERRELEAGVAASSGEVDDYLAKPFPIGELIIRLKGLVRGGQRSRAKVLRIYDLELNLDTRAVQRGGRAIHLTPREFALLEFLARHQGQVMTRAMIWKHLYGEQEEKNSNVVDVYIRYLRNKIDRNSTPALITTCWGKGYMLRGETPTTRPSPHDPAKLTLERAG